MSTSDNMKQVLFVVFGLIAIASAGSVGLSGEYSGYSDDGWGYNNWAHGGLNNVYGGRGWGQGYGHGWNGPIAHVSLTPDAQYLRDTPEVAHAKAAHAVAHASASHRNYGYHGINGGWNNGGIRLGYDSGEHYGYGNYGSAYGYPNQYNHW